MRVLLDTTYARRAPRSGTAVYLDALARELRALGTIELVEVANERRGPAGQGVRSSARNALADAAWTAIALPALARRKGAEVIHHPLPALAPVAGVPQVITVHDLAFERLPGCFDRRFRIYAHVAHRAAARRADAVICVSQTTAEDVVELWGVARERILVARHGPGQPLPGVSVADGRSHFLYVGDGEPRKDLATLLAGYRRYRDGAAAPRPLILAGRLDEAGPLAPAGMSVEPEPGARRLAELYAGAVALVHPALYEGFGLTLLEAMGCRTPVLAAGAGALPEICGGAARYFAPGDEAGLAAALHELAGQPGIGAALGAAGARRAAEFSWVTSARRHAAAYSLAVGS
ncbi:MAG: glycosyltransferase family 4 protein [Solirubrobacteraceae bacterium]